MCSHTARLSRKQPGPSTASSPVPSSVLLLAHLQPWGHNPGTPYGRKSQGQGRSDIQNIAEALARGIFSVSRSTAQPDAPAATTSSSSSSLMPVCLAALVQDDYPGFTVPKLRPPRPPRCPETAPVAQDDGCERSGCSTAPLYLVWQRSFQSSPCSRSIRRPRQETGGGGRAQQPTPANSRRLP